MAQGGYGRDRGGRHEEGKGGSEVGRDAPGGHQTGQKAPGDEYLGHYGHGAHQLQAADEEDLFSTGGSDHPQGGATGREHLSRAQGDPGRGAAKVCGTGGEGCRAEKGIDHAPDHGTFGLDRRRRASGR